MTIPEKSFHYSDLVITRNENPLKFDSIDDLPPNSSTDHMVEIDWDVNSGWHSPHIKPFAPLSLDPTSSCLHYATQCFEGLKCFRSLDGKSVRLIRPELNLARLNDSAKRGSLPEFNADELLKILIKYLSIESRFIKPGKFVYVRPYMIGTNPGLGVSSPSSAKLGIVLTLMKSWSDKPLRLFSSPEGAVRAWPGGFGSTKLGANYGPTMVQNKIAVSQGYDQVLWLFGEERLVTEAGASNFMAVWKIKDNNGKDKIEIITCSLDTNLILPGINRRSALEYLKEKHKNDDYIVSEKRFTIDDLEKASKEGRLLEAFAIGTAFFVAPVSEIRTPEGNTINVPLPQSSEEGVANDLRDHFNDLMYGHSKESNPWIVVVPEN